MPKKYENFGVRLLYPDNWQVEEHLNESPQGVTIQSPTGGFWTLHAYSASADQEELTSEVLQTMRAEYQSLEVEPINEQIGSHAAAGYDMRFYCLDMLVTSQVRTLTAESATYLLLYQAEDRDFEKLAQVFAAITTSLLTDDSSLPG